LTEKVLTLQKMYSHLMYISICYVSASLMKICRHHCSYLLYVSIVSFSWKRSEASTRTSYRIFVQRLTVHVNVAAPRRTMAVLVLRPLRRRNPIHKYAFCL